MDAKARSVLEEASKKAKAVIESLTGQTSAPTGTDRMPVSELALCQGLAFTFVHKLGVGLTYEQGTGFVVTKLPAVDEGSAVSADSWTWSAPLFIQVFSGGLGLTLGYSNIESVVVLDTKEAVQSFTRTQVTIDTDVGGALGTKLGAHLPVTDANMHDLNLTDKTFTYSVAKGAMVDFSLQGMTYKVDAKLNQALYGDATPEAILSGQVKAPESMQELYTAIDEPVFKLMAEQWMKRPAAKPAEQAAPAAKPEAVAVAVAVVDEDAEAAAAAKKLAADAVAAVIAAADGLSLQES